MKTIISIGLIVLFLLYVVFNAIVGYFEYKFKDIMNDEDKEDY